MSDLERWGHMRPQAVEKLADRLEITSNSTAIDPSYQPTVEDSGPRSRRIRPATPLIEAPSNSK